MSPSLPQKRILICSTAQVAYLEDEVQVGIRRFALNQPNWDIALLHAREVEQGGLDDALTWEPDGILMVARPSRVPQMVHIDDIPTVLVDLNQERPGGVSRICVNDEAIGSRAADYFIQNRFEQVAVVCAPGDRMYSALREDGFVRTALRQKLSPHRFEVQHLLGKPWYHNPEVDTWLKDLPKPIGIYCVQDAIAQQIIDHAHRLGIRVPGEISVVGTDNNHHICESIRPRLSSIPQPLETCGFRAAERLSELIQLKAEKKPLPVIQDAVEPDEVVVRQSSSLRAIPDTAIAAAASYLQDHALQDGTIAEAAKVAGLNRRAMERGFKKHLGVTPGQYMSEVKLDHAKRLLRETDLRMSDIAEACLMTQEHFATMFRKSTDITPSEYRRKRKIEGV